MKPSANPEESLYPVMQFLPVLSVQTPLEVPLKLLKALCIRQSTEAQTTTTSLYHYVCDNADLCHKKKAIHLFLAALSAKTPTAMTLWFSQDTSRELPVEFVSGKLSLTEPIQLFLAQAGLGIEATPALASFDAKTLLAGLKSASDFGKVA